MKPLSWFVSKLADETPRRNLAVLRHRIGARINPTGSNLPDGNAVLGELLQSPRLPSLISHALQAADAKIVFLGGGNPIKEAIDALRNHGREAIYLPFDSVGAKSIPPTATRVVLGHIPVTESEWEIAATLKQSAGPRFTLLTELLLPYTRISFLQQRVNYGVKSFEDILPFYLGEQFYNAVDRLGQAFPLSGKSVIEFGPFDGCQTAGLVHLGAAHVTCVEARPENATKAIAAAEVFRWPVRMIMDDFHNADAVKYGRFDLAFAHGVYYHAIAPFVFLENLCSLADAVFIGGFCGTAERPRSDWSILTHQGRSYRAKQYRENTDFMAGVNRVGYFFEGNDLMRFFSERGWRVQVITDDAMTVTAGRYLRFLATR